MRTSDGHWRFIGIVFATSYAWQAILYFTGGVDSRLVPWLMFIPALVAIVLRIRSREGFGGVGWGFRRWWYVAFAIAVPVMVMVGVATMVLVFGRGSWAGNIFRYENGLVDVRQLPLWLGSRTQHVGPFAVSFLGSLLVQSCLGSVATIGEEFGWRGYLQEKLIRRLGLNRGLLMLGVAWGYWHLPIGLMGWNFPDHPVLGAFLLTPLSMIFLGFFLGWLYLRSRSIWMPTLAHAAINLTASVLLVELDTESSDLSFQLCWIGAWGIVGGLCLASLNRSRPITMAETKTLNAQLLPRMIPHGRQW